jgi:hypothetical protein
MGLLAGRTANYVILADVVAAVHTRVDLVGYEYFLTVSTADGMIGAPKFLSGCCLVQVGRAELAIADDTLVEMP